MGSVQLTSTYRIHKHKPCYMIQLGAQDVLGEFSRFAKRKLLTHFLPLQFMRVVETLHVE
jgi:hypothetical protein